MTDDNDLRQRFEELRAEERASVRPFRALHEQRRPSLFRYRTAFALAALLLLILVPSVIISSRRSATAFTAEEQRIARSLGQWHPTTAFLLRTPGSDLLASTPSIPDRQTHSVIQAAKGVSQ